MRSTWESRENHMRITWEAHENHMRITCESHEKHMKITWESHENHMWITWEAHENHVRITWAAQENHMRITWEARENHMRITWEAHENHMEKHMRITWESHEQHKRITWESHEKHMRITWESHEKPHEKHMRITWESHEKHTESIKVNTKPKSPGYHTKPHENPMETHLIWKSIRFTKEPHANNTMKHTWTTQLTFDMLHLGSRVSQWLQQDLSIRRLERGRTLSPIRCFDFHWSQPYSRSRIPNRWSSSAGGNLNQSIAASLIFISRISIQSFVIYRNHFSNWDKLVHVLNIVGVCFKVF